MPTRPRLPVSSPAFTPLPYGLLSAVELPTAPEHWQNGVTWSSECVTGMGATTYDECLVVTGAGSPQPPPPASKTSNVQFTRRGATPFTVYTEFDCAPVGNEEAARVASAALNKVASFQLERAFWTGVAGGQLVVWPHLIGTATVIDGTDLTTILGTPAVTGGGATTDIADGLGFLENALSDCYGGSGVIHVPIEAVPTLDAWGLLKFSGGRVTTAVGNRVSIGAGYPGTAPDGTTPTAGTTWMYATGAVFAFTGPMVVRDLRDSIDRSKNTIRMIAEKTYVLGWDCCHAGVQVQLGVPVT